MIIIFFLKKYIKIKIKKNFGFKIDFFFRVNKVLSIFFWCFFFLELFLI